MPDLKCLIFFSIQYLERYDNIMSCCNRECIAIQYAFIFDYHFIDEVLFKSNTNITLNSLGGLCELMSFPDNKFIEVL